MTEPSHNASKTAGEERPNKFIDDQLGTPDRVLANSADLIMGVDRDLVEAFLVLIRDYYEKVDKATFFLEMRTGTMNVSGIRNIRGLLSHLVMLLDSRTPPEKRPEQLVNAEGHMRRAISEPYEVALDSLNVTFQAIYERYKKEILPTNEQSGSRPGVPHSSTVEARLREIKELESRGREAIRKNLWSPEWETGVSLLVDAFEKLFSLKSEIEAYCTAFSGLHEEEARQENLRKQLREEIHHDLAKEGKRSILLHALGISVGIAGIVVAILLVAIPGFADQIRHFFQAIFNR